MNDASLIAVGAIVTAFFGGLAVLLDKWFKNRSESRIARNADLQGFINLLQAQNERQQAQINEQQEAINEIHDEHSQCRVEIAELYGFTQMLYEFLTRDRERLARRGEEVEPMPPAPQRPQRAGSQHSDFLQRTTQHNTDLTKAAGSKVIQPSTKPGPTGTVGGGGT